MRGRPAAVRVPAHPRVCGENIARVMRLMGGYGSPPRVRGKRPRRRHAQRRRGLTPACAGKTSPPGPRSGRSAAHPRVCGENPTPSSSPPPTPWLTPACAGKTPDGAPPPPSSAHPRVCGENFSFNVQCVGEHGSPPRVRGKRELSGTRWIYSGLTPACAGKTGSTSSRSAPTCGPRAHPRVCGENSSIRLLISSSSGSPPRVRGKPANSCSEKRPCRLTPACAGKTPSGPGRTRGPRAHPRVCGENLVCRRTIHTFAGSPPRVRGKRAEPPGSPCGAGLTPACAGKTGRRGRRRGRPRAHPRVCGENHCTMFNALRRMGSPPRVRGKRCAGRRFSNASRLTPACAGKTSRTSHSRPGRAAHPRVCGENSAPASAMLTAEGSPPRVRGKQAGQVRHERGRGLTPACAGKTPRTPNGWKRKRAHPRVCGENGWAFDTGFEPAGSPPRVRGKRGGPHLFSCPRGLTPACAGKTTSSTPITSSPAAHPRVCGENDLARSSRAAWLGSPPRVRGKRPQGNPVLERAGLTPACAGKTRPRPWW